MKKYKLIKEYPGSPDIGYVSQPKVEKNVEYTDNHYYSGTWFDPSKFPEYWNPIEDFEILSFCGTESHPVPGFIVKIKNGKLDSDTLNLPLSHYLEGTRCWKINSVRRISDGEVFTIGDKLDGFDVTAIISLFRIENNQMKVGIREVGVVSLSACKHKSFWSDEDMISFGCFARGATGNPVTPDVFDWWKSSVYNKKK
jgi:hypothetical protein